MVFPEPLAPVMATRSPRSTCSVTGPRVKAPRRTVAPLSTATTCPDGRPAAMAMRRSHSLRGSSTTSSRSSIRSDWRALAACFSELATLRCLRILSLSAGLRRAARTPLSAQARWVRALARSPSAVSLYSS